MNYWEVAIETEVGLVKFSLSNILYDYQSPHGRYADSDWDAEGGEDIEFEIASIYIDDELVEDAAAFDIFQQEYYSDVAEKLIKEYREYIFEYNEDMRNYEKE